MLRLLFLIAALAFLGQLISCLVHGDFEEDDYDNV